jgi:uncharacterized membrane protein YwaF
MFSTTHFIWLAISVVLITSLVFLQHKFKLSFNFVINTMLIISVLSEVIKISCNMIPSPHTEGGKYLDPGDLPFHLCSIQIFLLFGLKFFVKTEKTRQLLLGFMAPTMLLGAIIALFVPTVGAGFNKLQVYQYFIFHCFLIFFSIYIIKEKLVDWKLKTYFYNLALLGCITLIALWLNSFLSVAAEVPGAFRRANFMYLTFPPMEGLPLLNLNNGWYVYFLTLIILVIVLVGIFHLAVTLPKYIKNKRNAKNQITNE